jgi:hypothetical protein
LQLTAAFHRGLYDELEKISAAKGISAEDRQRREKLKKWAKNTALFAAGTGAGTGTAMIGERLISSAFGARWKAMPKSKQMAILGPAIGIASVGGALLMRKALEEKRKADE